MLRKDDYVGKYMANESLDVMVSAIVDKEIADYKDKIRKEFENHFNNKYCARTDSGKVMYEEEVAAILNRI